MISEIDDKNAAIRSHCKATGLVEKGLVRFAIPAVAQTI